MKSKKLIALIMSATMVISVGAMFAACGGDKDDGKDDGKNPGGEVINPPVGGGEDNQFVEDTNNYFVAGASVSSDGTLYNQGWSTSNNSIKFTKDTTVTDENVFTIELKMYATDAFKILFADSWDDDKQVNAYSMVANDYFINGAGGNITCAEGQDGIYVFTLKTHPERDMGKYEVTVVQKSTIAPFVAPYDMSIMLNDASVKMVAKNGVWTADISVKKKDLKNDEDGNEATGDAAKYAVVYVHNAGKGGEGDSTKDFCDETAKKVGVTVEGVTTNVNLLEIGSYNITFNEEDGSVVIKKITDKWHVVVGGKLDATDVNLDLSYSGETGLWTGRVALTAESSVTLKNIADGATDADVTVGTLGAGNWVIKYNPETKEVDYEAVETYYLTGDFSDWGNGPKNGQAIKLEKTGDGVYSVTHTFDKDVSFKLVKGNFLDGATTWMNETNMGEGNIARGAGTYTITYNEGTNTITVEEAE